MSRPTLAGLTIGVSGALASAASAVLVNASPAFGVLTCASWGAVGVLTYDALRDQPRRWP